MTTSGNGELVRRGFEAFRRGDYDAVAEFLDPELRWHGGDPNAEGSCVGRDQALRFMRRAAGRRAAEGIAEPEVVEVIEAGDRVVIVLRRDASAGRGADAEDGAQECELVANLTTLRGGRAIEMVHYPDPHRAVMAAALASDATGQRALLGGDAGTAAAAFALSADLYRRSWELASPTSYGRLVGLVKAGILAGGTSQADAAGYVRQALSGAEAETRAAAETGAEAGASLPTAPSPTAAYAAALAALATDDDNAAAGAARRMRTAPAGAFGRTADAIAALAAGDGPAYASALGSIVADFESRAGHLTGVAIADTAVVLERLAEARGLAARPESPVLPPRPA